jgi:hypothetical protein
VAWLVVQTTGAYPQGRLYDFAVATLAWWPLATAVAGIAWIVRWRRGEAVGQGQVLWGAFHVTTGLVLWPVLGYSVLRLSDYCRAAWAPPAGHPLLSPAVWSEPISLAVELQQGAR